MPIIRPTARKMVDTCFPGVGQVYRTLRDQWISRAAPKPTPFGFLLAGNSSMAGGGFESDEAGEIAVFSELIQGAVACLDVGANIGFYTCLAASLGKHVVAVEPLASNLKLLYANLVANDFLDVEVFPLGLSDKGGIKRLYGRGTAASFVSGWAGTPAKDYEVVPVTTLDAITNLRFAGLPIFIKMDVEGFENEVLQGAETILQSHPKPVWLVEVCLNEHFPGGLNHKFCDTFATFWRHGYQASVADPSGRPVSPADVSRWAQNGRVDFGSHNYIFR